MPFLSFPKLIISALFLANLELGQFSRRSQTPHLIFFFLFFIFAFSLAALFLPFLLFAGGSLETLPDTSVQRRTDPRRRCLRRTPHTGTS